MCSNRLPKVSFSEENSPLVVRALLVPVVLGAFIIDAFATGMSVLTGWLARPRRPSETATCPLGHEVPLEGWFACSCGNVFEGHATEPCPACGLSSDTVLVSCACGATITLRGADA